MNQSFPINEDLWRKSNIFATICVIFACLYVLLTPSGAYGLFLELCTAVSIWPMMSIAYIFFSSREIAFGIFFLTVFQTWNMFLHPYWGEEQYTAVYRTVNEAYLPLMGFVSGLSLFALYYGFKYGYRQIMVRPFWEYQSFDLSHITKLIIWSLAFGICNSTIQILLGQMGLKISFLSSLNMMVPAVVGALLTIYFLRDGRNILIAVFSVLYLIYSFIYIVGGTLFIYVIVMISGPLVSYITERKKYHIGQLF